MKDKLIEKLNSFPTWLDTTLKERWMPEAVERLAKHLLGQGVLVPPCNVGDTMWWIAGCTYRPHSVEVTKLEYTKSYGFDICVCTRNDTRYNFNETDIGKIVFHTREEAEQALAERSKQ